MHLRLSTNFSFRRFDLVLGPSLHRLPPQQPHLLHDPLLDRIGLLEVSLAVLYRPNYRRESISKTRVRLETGQNRLVAKFRGRHLLKSHPFPNPNLTPHHFESHPFEPALRPFPKSCINLSRAQLLAFPSSTSTAHCPWRMIRLILRRILRAFLKRAPPSFTVEIRRQQKRTAMGVNPGWVQTKLAHSTFDGEPRRVASPAPKIRKVDAPAAEPAAPRPSGRILPNLAEIELQNNRPLEAPSSEAAKIPVIKSASERKSRAMTDARQVGRPRGRPKSSAAEIASPMNSAPTPPGSSSAGRLDEATAIPPSRPFAPPASTAARNSASATPARVSRHAKPSKSVASPRTPPLLEALQPVIGADAPSVQTPSAAGRPSDDRRRKILGRYVFGDDLKPGERWKRRLPKSALR